MIGLRLLDKTVVAPEKLINAKPQFILFPQKVTSHGTLINAQLNLQRGKLFLVRTFN